MPYSRVTGANITFNVGTFDRIARIVLGIALLAFTLGYLARHSGNWVG